MAKQYAIVSTNPKAGQPQFMAGPIAFGSLAAAETSRNGTIEALHRAGDDTRTRQWDIIELDAARMLPGVTSFRERLRWAVKYTFGGYRLRLTGKARHGQS
jgi:hypothetical protein